MNVTIIGAGSIGTALGNILARKGQYEITLLSIEEDVVHSITNSRYNHKYFPTIKLSKALRASSDSAILKRSDIIFLAIPSAAIVDFVLQHKNSINENAIVLNLAKGFSKDQRMISESLEEIIPNPVCSFKGPTFAREMINKVPTAFTLGSKDKSHYKLFKDLFDGTNVHIDFTTDVKGVEVLSLLKNIYAIAMGIIDAQYDAPNLRFLFLTKAFNEMKDILLQFDGKEDTMFKYCGYGDFGLTALNDLSRNRTLGLLIGKGFFVDDISDKVTLEGKIAVGIFCEKMSNLELSACGFPIMSELYKVFNEGYDLSIFVNEVIKS
jgi:glycerol-3-phosphate dehydrogenase (NAD(P)+)